MRRVEKRRGSNAGGAIPSSTIGLGLDIENLASARKLVEVMREIQSAE